MAQPRKYVERPSFTPLPFGLLSSLQTEIRNPAEPHWQGGVTWESLCGTGNTTFDECLTVTGTGGPPPPPPSKTDNGGRTTRGALPFTVFAEVDCSPVGNWDDIQSDVATVLARTEQYQVEQAFWTGLAGGRQVVYPHLASSTELYDASGALLQTIALESVAATGNVSVDVVEGIAYLESALATCYNGVGVIHVTRRIATHMAAFSLLTQEGGRLRTVNGNVVVVGSGYTGSGPTGSTSVGADAAYATGMPFIYRSAAYAFRREESLDRSDNTVKAIAERTYVIGWDCCHYHSHIQVGGIPGGLIGDAGFV